MLKVTKYIKKLKTREKLHTKEVTICQEIREFIDGSRMLQTMYAKREGAFGKRVFNINFENDLLIYIQNTLYDSNCFILNLIQLKNLIFQKIISLKTKYSSNKEVHLTVIWVYYFVYETKETKSMAVFKVFTSEKEAIFISTEGTTYLTWDDFLDNNLLPHSFLCVPQHGIYNFEGNEPQLRLNYFIAHNSMHIAF